MWTWYKKQKAKTESTKFTWFYFVFPNSFYFHIAILIFRTLFICLVFRGLLQSLYFQKLCTKHSITFENMWILSCWFHCVDVFYIKFRFGETHRVTNSVTRILIIETLPNIRTIKSWFTIYIHIYVLSKCKCYSV